MSTHFTSMTFTFVCPHCGNITNVSPTGDEWMNNFWHDVETGEYNTVANYYESDCAHCNEHVTVNF